MGRKWSRKRKAEDQSNRRKTERKDDRQSAAFFHYDKFNVKMESYYALQGLHSHRRLKEDEQPKELNFVPCQSEQEMEEERRRWVTSLAQILPASFRIAQDQEQDLRDRLETELNQFVGSEFDISVTCSTGLGDELKTETTIPFTTAAAADTHESTTLNQDPNSTDATLQHISEAVMTKKMAPIRPIPFIPHAYQLSIDKHTIRRNPLMESFHKWLMVNSDAGFLSRLETVSMIPPVVLAPEPHHHILVRFIILSFHTFIYIHTHIIFKTTLQPISQLISFF